MKMKITKEAECAICKQSHTEGVVISLDNSGRPVCSIVRLQNFKKETYFTTGSRDTFICEDCLKSISGLALSQFIMDGCEIKADSKLLNLIEDRAVELIRSAGYTTSLLVKESLRAEGYLVLQKDVSETLRECLVHNNYDFPIDVGIMDGENFNTYFLDKRVPFTVNFNGADDINVDSYPVPSLVLKELKSLFKAMEDMERKQNLCGLVTSTDCETDWLSEDQFEIAMEYAMESAVVYADLFPEEEEE